MQLWGRADYGLVDTAEAWETVDTQPEKFIHTERKGWRWPRGSDDELILMTSKRRKWIIEKK